MCLTQKKVLSENSLPCSIYVTTNFNNKTIIFVDLRNKNSYGSLLKRDYIVNNASGRS